MDIDTHQIGCRCINCKQSVIIFADAMMRRKNPMSGSVGIFKGHPSHCECVDCEKIPVIISGLGPVPVNVSRGWLKSHHPELAQSKEEKKADKFIIRLPHNLFSCTLIVAMAPLFPIFALLIWLGDRLQHFHHKYIHPIDTYVRNERLADEVIGLRAQNKELLQRVGQQGEYR